MTRELAVSRMLRELRSDFPSPRPTQEEALREARHVAFMNRVLRDAKRPRRRSAWASLAAAALICLASGAALRFARTPLHPRSAASGAQGSPALATRVTPLGGSVRVQSASTSSERTLSGPESLPRGGSVRLDATAKAVLELPIGASVRVAENSNLRLEGSPEHEALRLSVGRVDLAVPPLRPRSLVVITPDTRVTVVGTRFSVSVDAAAPGFQGRTCVAVVEGHVAVASAGASPTLGKGDSWSSDGLACQADVARLAPTAATTVSPQTPAGPVHTVAPRARGVEGSAPAAASAPEPPSRAAQTSLVEQNRLFAAALRAREQGDRAQAKRLWDELVTRFPEGTLAPQAERELHKLELSDPRRNP